MIGGKINYLVWFYLRKLFLLYDPCTKSLQKCTFFFNSVWNKANWIRFFIYVTWLAKKMLLFSLRKRPKRWLVVRENTPKYHYLTLCIFQLMEAGGGGERDIEVGLLLCMYVCGASIILFVHDKKTKTIFLSASFRFLWVFADWDREGEGCNVYHSKSQPTTINKWEWAKWHIYGRNLTNVTAKLNLPTSCSMCTVVGHRGTDRYTYL